MMHAKTQMNSEHTKQSEVSPSQKDRRYLAHLKRAVNCAEHLSCRRCLGVRYVMPSVHLRIENTILTHNG